MRFIANLALTLSNFSKEILSFFNLSHDLEPQSVAESEIRSGVSFKGSQLLILIFAIFIASLGLNTNSIPVIIGAMLISPLMGPIIGMGLGIAIQDFDLLKRALRNILMAVVGSLIASAIYFLISPLYDGSSQLLARTSPSIYDVFIALFGGAAGILSIVCKNKGQVMPGVAIATSLMPPLCTAGYGLATLQMNFFFGALYLFITNLVFILVSSWIVIKIIGYKSKDITNTKRASIIKNIMFIIIILMISLSVYLTFVMINKNIFINNASSFVEREMNFPNTQVLSHSEYIKNGKHYIDVNLIGASLPIDSLKLAMINKLDSAGLGGTILNIKQGFGISSLTKNNYINDDKVYTIMQKELLHNQMVIDSLNNIIRNRNYFSQQGDFIAKELNIIYPNIKDIALSNTIASRAEGELSDTLNLVFINAPKGLSSDDRSRIKKYIETRCDVKNATLILNPQGFPWPLNRHE
jgi:uncharacterized hydrophobic protein (TIGR00271 family)